MSSLKKQGGWAPGKDPHEFICTHVHTNPHSCAHTRSHAHSPRSQSHTFLSPPHPRLSSLAPSPERGNVHRTSNKQSAISKYATPWHLADSWSSVTNLSSSVCLHHPRRKPYLLVSPPGSFPQPDSLCGCGFCVSHSRCWWFPLSPFLSSTERIHQAWCRTRV